MCIFLVLTVQYFAKWNYIKIYKLENVSNKRGASNAPTW